VSATVRLLGRVTMPSGALVAGAVAGIFTPRTALVALMVLLAIVPAWLFVSPLGRVLNNSRIDSGDCGPDSEQTAATSGRPHGEAAK